MLLCTRLFALFLTSLAAGSVFAQTAPIAQPATSAGAADAPKPAEVAKPAEPVLPTLQKVRDTGVLVIAHREASIPFSYLDADKKPVGYALELCLKVAEALRRDLKLPGLRVEFVPVSSANRIPTIAQGKADLECGSTTNNAARRKEVAFAPAHYFAGARLLVRSNSGIKRLSDLRGKRIVTTRGTTTATALKASADKGIVSATLVEAKDHDEAFAMLEKGEADAFAMDDILLYSQRANAKDPARWDVVGEFISVEPLAVMLRKGDPEFKRYVDGVISRAMIDGEVRKLYGRWFLSPIPPKGVNLGIPMSPLLREQMLFPTDKVGDELGG
ncbi:MAG: amino acid ABC transporter substrate-binding protein [Betaproteobacteria bacterium]